MKNYSVRPIVARLAFLDVFPKAGNSRNISAGYVGFANNDFQFLGALHV